MVRFPESDAVGALVFAEHFQNVAMIEQAHRAAEKAIPLYALVHRVLDMQVRTTSLSPRAFLAGVQAFEIVGGFATDQESRELLDPLEVGHAILDRRSDHDPLITFLEDANTAYEMMKNQAPETLEAVKHIVSVELPDSSPELQQHANAGAAVLCAVQREAELIADMRSFLDTL